MSVHLFLYVCDCVCDCIMEFLLQPPNGKKTSGILETLYPLNNSSHTPTEYLIVATIIVSASVGLTISDTAYEWNHAEFVFLRLSYFI